MKKKFFTFIFIILTLFSLSSCRLISDDDSDYGLDPSVQTTEITTTYSDVYNQIYSSCFGVRNDTSSTGYKIGSSVCIKKDNIYSYFLTNRHVIEAEQSEYLSNNISIYFGNGYYVSGSVVASTTYTQRSTDESKDLAIIKIKTPINKTIIPVTIGDDIVKKGQNVLAVGCPNSLKFYNSLTVGVVSKVHTSTHLVQHQATINPGNSGGGLFNLAGRLIGINVSRLSPPDELVESVGFAIDISRVREFLSDAKFEL